jgi:hypothetical protein
MIKFFIMSRFYNVCFVFFLPLCFLISCRQNSTFNDKNRKKDGLLLKKESAIVNQPYNSVSTQLSNSNFKKWLRDTVKVINDYKENEPGLISKKIEITPDSLILKVSYKISKVINNNAMYSSDTFIGTVIDMLKSNGVRLPLNFEIRIKADFFSEESAAPQLIHDDWMELPYVSIWQVGKKNETFYTLIKGNLTGIKEDIYKKNW